MGAAAIAAKDYELLLCRLSTLIVRVADVSPAPRRHGRTHNRIVAAHRRQRAQGRRELLHSMRTRRSGCTGQLRQDIDARIRQVQAVPEDRLLRDRLVLIEALDARNL